MIDLALSIVCMLVVALSQRGNFLLWLCRLHHTFGMLWAVHVVHPLGEHFNLWGCIGQRGRFIRHRTMVYLLIS
ncbi:hypothetical protein IG605_018880 [Pectobacterium quasiaquaticum]|uniref:Uncharacterized protein n=1 Tax=Pectobacterium quasiaquaticum TaxID=2774015 RepID=A0A9Q2ID58_9GAMM|nr:MULTISPECIES: hypothetical protein [Pectobacterium]MBE5201788.1 hypothetical protein [Pectobacterium quasiaquaticum]MBE5210103.1 hypothetical protein [Pectobacterium quasiaquaticum]MBE5212926.1 hypothetical protein [Pectobacterium quasiaquaticum]MBE5222957.1 hypothetical protein [Pectobacterium quasiaquaticum]MBE5227014.1 hypothetical protein [Pectobacterium quasiaquaticum]